MSNIPKWPEDYVAAGNRKGKVTYSGDDGIIICGNVMDILPDLPEGTIQTCVTSPPYYSLREYGIPPTVWGGDPGCDHDWQSAGAASESYAPGQKKKWQHDPDMWKTSPDARVKGISLGSVCSKCGAWLGTLGLESSPDLFVAHLSMVMAEVWRVLRKDGTLWLNLGDSFSGSWGNYNPGGYKGQQRPQTEKGRRYERPAYEDVTFRPPTSSQKNTGWKPKDLMGIPHRVAFALQGFCTVYRGVLGGMAQEAEEALKSGDNGKLEALAARLRGLAAQSGVPEPFWLRNDIVWHKLNSMPESVKDRCCTAHEHIFLMAKDKRYYFDHFAIREPHTASERPPGNTSRYYYDKDPQHGDDRKMRPDLEQAYHPAGRGKRDVWNIATAPNTLAHFATFPPDLVRPCVLAGSSPRECPECGAPWHREVEYDTASHEAETSSDYEKGTKANLLSLARQAARAAGEEYVMKVKRQWWEPGCKHGELDREWGSIVLDPFGGSGTTSKVARDLNRRFISIEASEEYCKLHIRRLTESSLPRNRKETFVRGQLSFYDPCDGKP